MPPSIEELLMFVRYPEPGVAKTRLIPMLGAERAAGTYRRMAEHVAEIVRSFDRPGLKRTACFEPASRALDIADWLGAGFTPDPQPDGDLGTRLTHAFFRAFRDGARRVVAIGTDCVEIDAEILTEAFDALEDVDAAVGPSLDGGYYLIGLSRPCMKIFRGIPWSTDRTLRETLARLRSCGFRVRILSPLNGIHTPEDLENARW